MPYYDFMGLDAIGAERLRQMEVEGYTAGHDDEHMRHEMVVAARSYLVAGTVAANGDDAASMEPLSDWPWGRESWKPSNDPIKNYAKAGALIAAEIDRQERVKQRIVGRGPGGGRSVAGL